MRLEAFDAPSQIRKRACACGAHAPLLKEICLYRFFLVNPRLAHLFMICSNIKLTGPAESIRIDALAIHERNQIDSTMAVQRRLEFPADANPARGIPRKALPFIVLGDHYRPSPHLLDGAGLVERFKPKAAQLGFATAAKSRVRENYADQQEPGPPDRSQRRRQGAGDGAPVLSVAIVDADAEARELSALRRGPDDSGRPAAKIGARGLNFRQSGSGNFW